MPQKTDFIQEIKGLILDMDGVLWRDREPIGNLPAIFARLQALGLQVMLATNNATRTPAQHLEKLRGFGVELEEHQVVNSAMATAYLLLRRFPQGGQIYVIGEDGIRTALQESGFELPEQVELARPPLAVVVGMDRQITYEKLSLATLLIRAGVPFYATNPDRTFPTPIGLVPGAGAIVAAVIAAAGQEPIWAGKPEPALMHLCLERMHLSPRETLVVGDRLETDIAGGQAASCRTALVLSGASTRAQAESWHPPADLLARDLAALVAKF